MKTEHFASNSGRPLCNLTNSNLERLSQSHLRSSGAGHLYQAQRGCTGAAVAGSVYSDRDSVLSVGSGRVKKNRLRNISMKSSSKGMLKKGKSMDYTNYAYNEAVGKLKVMLATDSYATPKSSYLRHVTDESDNYSDNLSVIERPVFSDISKYLSPGQRTRMGGSSSYRSKKPVQTFSSPYSASKENLSQPYPTLGTAAASTANMDYMLPSKPPMATGSDCVQAPVEIFNFIEKQEDYIEQLEKESKYCRNELTNLLGKVKDVINENEQLTETARHELAHMHHHKGSEKHHVPMTTTSPSSDSDVMHYVPQKKSSAPGTPRKAKESTVKSPRYSSAPNIVYEARISELEAELMQAQIDLKRLKNENDDLKRKLKLSDPTLALVPVGNCDTHRKQIDMLQQDKQLLEETVRQLQKSLDEAKSQQYTLSSKRYVNDLVQMERSQAELEVRHLRDELDRQHERVRELQHEMARRIAEERSNAERRYNTQVDQLGGDLSNQWEQVAKLQLDLERQKRYETDLKRDLANRNSQIEELKSELRSNRSTFLADMAQVNAEKQSLEQEITALRLQLDRSARESKTEAARLNAEINSLRQRLDRGDADLLHSKREVLRLNDEIANLEKELAYGEMKNEIRPTKKDLDKRISEMQDKHVETVSELEDMIQKQKLLMDRLTGECKMLTNKLEDTTLKHKTEISSLQSNVEYLTNRMLSNDRLGKLDHSPNSYSNLTSGQANLDYKPSTFGTADLQSTVDDYKPSNYNYDALLNGDTGGASSGGQLSTERSGGGGGGRLGDTNTTVAPTATASSYELGDDVGKSLGSAYDIGKSTSGDYSKPSSYKYGSHQDDDENLKDNIGEGEKQSAGEHAYKPSSLTSAPAYDIDTKSDYRTETSHVQPDVAANVAAASSNNTVQPAPAQPADSGQQEYTTDYGGYEGYDQNQYDTSTYDPSVYDQQQYGTNNQYNTGGAADLGGYDPSAYGNYGTGDYDPTAYQQYDTSVNAQPTPQPTGTQSTPTQQVPMPSANTTAMPTGQATSSGVGELSAARETRIKSPPQTQSPGNAALAANPVGRATADGRPQPPASGRNLGSSGLSREPSAPSKPPMSQQPAAAASKK